MEPGVRGTGIYHNAFDIVTTIVHDSETPYMVCTISSIPGLHLIRDQQAHAHKPFCAGPSARNHNMPTAA